MVVVIDMITGEVLEERNTRIESDEYAVQQQPEHAWRPMIQPGLQEVAVPHPVPHPKGLLPPAIARINIDDFLRQMDDPS